MSLSYNISYEKVNFLYNSLVKIHKKNIYYFATPTNETYRTYSGSYSYDREYTYKFCYLPAGEINFNQNVYTATSNLSCYYFKEDNSYDLKTINRIGSVNNTLVTFTNAKEINVPHLTIENYGEVFTNGQFTLIIFTIAFFFVWFILRNVMPKLR